MIKDVRIDGKIVSAAHFASVKASANQFLQAATSRFMAPRGLRVMWFEGWHPALDEALRTLPEAESCPHELYRLLVQNPTPSRKRIALITEQGRPVALVALRQRYGLPWEPVTQWLIPGLVFPACSGFTAKALEALGMELRVAWWRMAVPPPQSRWVRYSESTPTYRFPCSGDFEHYWRETGHFKDIRNKRNRCRNFTVTVNLPGATEWVMKNWETTWFNAIERLDSSLADRIVAAQYLEAQNKHYTFLLSDQGDPIGGATAIVHGNTLVAGVIYRAPEYEKYGIGIRLIDLIFSFAAETGFDWIDIGGGQEYKKRWAPQDGEHWHFTLCPEPLYQLRQMVKWGRGFSHKLTHGIDSSKVLVA